jgi:hypothetical protein
MTLNRMNFITKKYSRYLSIDLNTKDSLFEINFYSKIKKYFIENGFEHIKDTNYKIVEKISDTKRINIQENFILSFPEIGAVVNKFD